MATMDLMKFFGLILLFVISVHGKMNKTGICTSIHSCDSLGIKNQSESNHLEIEFMVNHTFGRPAILLIFPRKGDGILHEFSNVSSGELYKEDFYTSGDFWISFTRLVDQEAERLLTTPINNTFTWYYAYQPVNEKTEEQRMAEQLEAQLELERIEQQEIKEKEEKRLKETAEKVKKMMDEEENERKLQKESENKTETLQSPKESMTKRDTQQKTNTFEFLRDTWAEAFKHYG